MSDSSCVRISDPNLGRKENGLAATWALGNRLASFVRPKKPIGNPSSSFSGGGGQPKFAARSGESRVHEVVWETTLYEPVFRKLVNESAQIFLSLQQQQTGIQPTGGSKSVSPFVKMSRQYRSILRDCQEQLDRQAERGGPPDKTSLYFQQSELLYKLELIWNLVEVLSIESTPNGMVLPQLLHWIYLHFPQGQEQARRVLNDPSDQAEEHPDYWEAATRLIMQGRMDQARPLLKLHSNFGQDSFLSIDELLRKMPLYDSSQSAPDFDFRWRHWQTEVIARIEEGDFNSEPSLLKIARLLAGKESEFEALISQCETWYEWMIARLLYTNPTVKIYDLSYHAESAISKFGGLASMTTLDSVLLATFEQDMAQVMHELCSTLDNFWFPAHLLDLLHHVDPNQQFGLESADPLHKSATSGSLREFLLLDYATCLMSHQSLWQTGILYFDHCPLQGRPRLELLLERIPLSDERKANKVLQFAGERGMTTTVSATCKVMGVRAFKEGRLCTAMAWGLRSHDAAFTTFLADRLLAHYVEEPNFQSADLLDNLGSSMVVSDRLTFLAKYREFHKLCEQSEFPAAVTLLHSLLWSRLAPKYFWVTLLIDALPFLNNQEETFFSSEQTYELMHCLQELTKDNALPKKQQLLLTENERLIRMKLAKNLTLSLMNEGDEENGSAFSSSLSLR